MSVEDQKKIAAEAALEYIQVGDIIGVGTGSTANYFIDALAGVKGKLDGTVASSEATADRLRGIRRALRPSRRVGLRAIGL